MDRGKQRLLSTDIGANEDYRDLVRAHLISVKWADDKPRTVTITDAGRNYAEGWFEDMSSNGTFPVEDFAYKPMFSLVVRANPDFPVGRSRLFDGTPPELFHQFMRGDVPDLAMLAALPAVLTPEFAADDEHAIAVLGYIDFPSLNPVISNPILTFPSKRLLDLGIIGKWMNMRTRWTICEGDPFKLFINSAVTLPERIQTQRDRAEVDEHFVAVMMPFELEAGLDPVYQAITRGCSNAGFECRRVDENSAPGSIVDDIKQTIDRAGVVLVDLTGEIPNVMYEYGFAHGRDKQVICLQCNDVKLSFDVSQYRTIAYHRDKAGLEDLSEKIANSLKDFEACV